jgi:hypothetical protein
VARHRAEAAQCRIPLPHRPGSEHRTQTARAVAAAALDLGFACAGDGYPPGPAAGRCAKGTAVRRLLEESGLQRALYAGDDTTDLDGFTALDGHEAAVRVAVVSAEGPSELGERADVVVGSTDAFRELLEQL